MSNRLTRPSLHMRRCILTACLAVLPVTSVAYSQTDVLKPFDMAPEIGDLPKPDTSAAPKPVQSASEPVSPASAPVKPTPAESSQIWQRYIVPSDTLAMTGEQYQHSWNISLTAKEANAPTQLKLAYQSSVLVAPESSYFTINVNNTEILRQQIQSADKLSEIAIDVPQSLLKAGANTFTIRAHQRHRTDCTIDSTYELWTNIDPSKTYLAFDLPESTAAQINKRFMGNEDISAIGVDAKGKTQFNIIAPALNKGENGTSLLNLSQALAMLGGMPNQSFSVERFLTPAHIHPEGSQSGELTVLVGTTAELSGALENFDVAPDTNSTSSMRFITNAQTGEQFLLISGNNWRDVTQNIEQLVAMTARPANTLRSTLHTQNWNLPDAKMLRDATVLTFAELGIPTQQFSGRKLSNQFTFGIPADFYANAYGSATILLDAALSAAVLPGSHIDIYVNGNIATTIPISDSGGSVMNQLPINVAMRNFRPGLNTITIEASLLTAADKACVTGTAASQTPRFALFDTSKFIMPSFGRIGQTPNLAATAAIAYPYSYSQDDLQIFANLTDYNVLSASATIMGNFANAAGRTLMVKEAQPESDLKNGNALFIGAISNLPELALMQTGIDPQAKGIWSDDDAAPTSDNPSFNSLSQWQEQLQSGWSGRIQKLYNKLRESFNISDGLRLFPGTAVDYIPSPAVSVVVAQGSSPSATGAWTVVTAQDNVMLRSGVEMLAQQINWTKVEGRISSFNQEQKAVETRPVQNSQFVMTQPFSFANMRLVATNWLSSNTLSYVVVVLASLIALGLATSAMLSRFGRRDDEE